MASILVISAHPDDETLFAGGTLTMYVNEGHSIYILETTRGEGGEVGDPPLATPETLAAVRELEVRNAAEKLGAADIFFLPFVDPHMEIDGIPRHIDVPIETFAAAIDEYIKIINPNLIITHGSNGEYGHPQHIYTHQATLLALNNHSPEISLMSWSAWFEPAERERVLNQDDPADIVRDVTQWLDTKIEAARCHKTQHAMFLRNTGAPTVADMVLRTESFHIWRGPLPQGL